MPDIFVSPPAQKTDKENQGTDNKKNTDQSGRLNAADNLPKPQINTQGRIIPPQKKPSPLAALMFNPPDVCFETQDTDEKVIFLLRQHWVTNLPWITIGVFLLLIPPLIFLIRLFFNFSFPIPFPILLAGCLFWYLISLGYLFINFLIWYFNAYLITNERVIDIDFIGLTYKQVSATRIEKIQDVTFKVGGIIRPLFDYGDVFIQTASEEPNFEFHAVPKPAFVADQLGELMEKAGAGSGV